MSGDVDPETRRQLEDALANLPWLQREVFMLHVVDGYSYAEIARQLRTKERSVEWQLARAICKLVKQMDGHKLSWWERWI